MTTTVKKCLLTVAEAAKVAAVSERTVWRWIDAGRLPAVQPAGPRTAVRIDPSELAHFRGSDRFAAMDDEVDLSADDEREQANDRRAEHRGAATDSPSIAKRAPAVPRGRPCGRLVVRLRVTAVPIVALVVLLGGWSAQTSSATQVDERSATLNGTLYRNNGDGPGDFASTGAEGGTNYSSLTRRSAFEATKPSPSQVTTGYDRTEFPPTVASGIPVAPRSTPGGSTYSRLVYSIRAHSVTSAETILARGTVYLSSCISSDINPPPPPLGNAHNPCTHYYADVHPNRTPYSDASGSYVPDIGVKVTMTGAPTQDPTRGAEITGWSTSPCNVGMHRCVLSARNSKPMRGLTPLQPAYFNLIVSAYDPHAPVDDNRNPKDVIELNADCAKDAAGRQDYKPCKPLAPGLTDCTGFLAVCAEGGQLSIAREGRYRSLPPLTPHYLPANDAQCPSYATPGKGKCVRISTTQASRGRGYVVRTARLTSLHPGDVIDAYGIVEAAPDPANDRLPPCTACEPDGRNYPGGAYEFNHFIGSQILLTDTPGATKLRGAGPYGEWITPHNGTNCIVGRHDCRIYSPITFTKPSVVSVPAAYDGRTMYVNLIANATDPGVRDDSNNRVPDRYAIVDILPGSNGGGSVLRLACMDADASENGSCGSVDYPSTAR
jgi:excisionase family DNA binding protein